MYLLNNNRNGRYNYRQPIKQQSVMMPIQHVPSQFKKENELVAPKPRVKEMLWGEPTWLLFHTLAEKVKEEEFTKIRQEFLNQIMKICNNLPCPECSKHATIELNKVRFDTMNDKEQLKKMLYNFHNHVNKNLKKPLYDEENLKIYEKANFNTIMKNFLLIFNSNIKIPQLMNQAFHRQHNIPKITEALYRIAKNFKV